MEGFSFARRPSTACSWRLCARRCSDERLHGAFAFTKIPFKARGSSSALTCDDDDPRHGHDGAQLSSSHVGLLDTFTGLVLRFGQALACLDAGNALKLIAVQMTRLSESAMLDGASLYRTFFSIALPMVAPTLATMILLAFMGSWNSYLWPLIVLTSTDKQTLQVVLGNMNGIYKNKEHILMAGAVLTILPILAVYLLTQSRVDSGISLGGLK
jgi:multiple sugar transport system permease protein